MRKVSDPAVLSSEELRYARLLAEHGVTDDLRANAAELLAGEISDEDVRRAWVAAWSSVCGDRHVMEHAPGGLGATAGEIDRARRWRSLPGHNNAELAYYHAVLYAAPSPPPIFLGPPPTNASLAAGLADSICSGRHRAWSDAYQWTPDGYKLRKGAVDPAPSWTETPDEIGERVFPTLKVYV